MAMLSSCDNQKSVQEYYVEKQESNNFIALDLPASIVSLDEGASEETRETLKERASGRGHSLSHNRPYVIHAFRTIV